MFKKSLIFTLLAIIVNLQSLEAQLLNFSKEDSTWAKKIISKLNTRQRIAQLFMADISPKLEQVNKKEAVMKLIKKNQIGGLIIMKGEYGLTAEWIRDFQKATSTPLLVSIDGEWGINMRIGSSTKFPYALTLGAINNDSLIFEMGKAIAKDCKKLGIHVNFAPVVDVNTNPKNPVINFRSFGENKYKVSKKGINLALGMQSEGVMACAKHFPGHGDTDMDSHLDLPIIRKPKSSLEDIELFPFNQLIDANVWSIMVGHLNVPSLDSSGKPSSLSKPIITDLLKNEMGFEGLVFSDALNMKGAVAGNSPGQMELDAYIAGNDILLFSENIETAIQKIEAYVTSDKTKSNDLESRVYKLLLFKHKLNAMAIPEMSFSMDESSNVSMAENLYKQAITFVSSEKTSNDYIIDTNKSTLFLSLTDNQTDLRKSMEGFKNFAFSKLGKNATAADYTRLLEGLNSYQQIIIAYHDLSQYDKSSFGLNANQINFIKDVNEKSGVINLWFGNPYGLKYFQNAKNVLIAYEENPKTQKAVFQFLKSNEKITGKLPVTVGKFKEGASYLNSKIVQRNLNNTTTVTDNVEIPSDQIDYSKLDKPAILQRVETICNEIVANRVAPGGQVYVLYKGKEIYNKAFGYQTYYPESQPVKTSDFYDLASVSKIMGTTLAVMKLKDMGKLNINDKVGDHLHYLDETNTIADIPLSQLLTHEAGLTPFIPFFQRFNDSNFYQYFRGNAEAGFTTKVAENLYVRDDYKDTMWFETSHNQRTNIGKYKYSDLSMYILQRVVEAAAGMPLDEFLYKNFYKPMGINLCYKPTEKYAVSRIAPTELDSKFRLQLVHGYVHDQGCSLYGGVCGHAGLFGCASDVAKVMQMLIQGGKYNNKQYIKTETISQFTSQQNPNSRRGLGFDKPNVDDLSSSPTSTECSFATFGHTGFTGTCAWADPFSELVFVFLSNRVHPNAENKKLAKGNYRERIQSLFYQYIK